MTDKKLLELAANAAGYALQDDDDEGLSWVVWDENNNPTDWNPLTDDGDALRLAVKLNISFVEYKDTIVKSRAVSWTDGTARCSLWEPEGNDPYAATRRAIVRAAAEIGKTL